MKKTQLYPKADAAGVNLFTKPLTEWIGESGGLATLGSNGRLDSSQTPDVNIGTYPYKNIFQENDLEFLKSELNSLLENQIKMYGLYKASALTSGYSQFSEDESKWLFNKDSVTGYSLGDILVLIKNAVLNLAGTRAYIIHTQDAKAPSDSFVGTDGVETIWDKTLINKIPGIEYAVNNVSPTRGGANMNDCLETGFYPWCVLGRPAGADSAFTLFTTKSSNPDNNGYYTIYQICIGREGAFTNRLFSRFIFFKNTEESGYTEWKELSNDTESERINKLETTVDDVIVEESEGYKLKVHGIRFLKDGEEVGHLDVTGDNALELKLNNHDESRILLTNLGYLETKKVKVKDELVVQDGSLKVYGPIEVHDPSYLTKIFEVTSSNVYMHSDLTLRLGGRTHLSPDELDTETVIANNVSTTHLSTNDILPRATGDFKIYGNEGNSIKIRESGDLSFTLDGSNERANIVAEELRWVEKTDDGDKEHLFSEICESIENIDDKLSLTSIGALGTVKDSYGFYGIKTPDNDDFAYIRTTGNGFIPYMPGSATDGHCTIGTQTWQFKEAYINTIYGYLSGVAENSCALTTLSDLNENATGYSIADSLPVGISFRTGNAVPNTNDGNQYVTYKAANNRCATQMHMFSNYGTYNYGIPKVYFKQQKSATEWGDLYRVIFLAHKIATDGTHYDVNLVGARNIPIFSDASGRGLYDSGITIDSNQNVLNIKDLYANNLNSKGVIIGDANQAKSEMILSSTDGNAYNIITFTNRSGSGYIYSSWWGNTNFNAASYITSSGGGSSTDGGSHGMIFKLPRDIGGFHYRDASSNTIAFLRHNGDLYVKNNIYVGDHLVYHSGNLPTSLLYKSEASSLYQPKGNYVYRSELTTADRIGIELEDINPGDSIPTYNATFFIRGRLTHYRSIYSYEYMKYITVFCGTHDRDMNPEMDGYEYYIFDDDTMRCIGYINTGDGDPVPNEILAAFGEKIVDSERAGKMSSAMYEALKAVCKKSGISVDF